jgi:hypothetical protein
MRVCGPPHARPVPTVGPGAHLRRPAGGSSQRRVVRLRDSGRGSRSRCTGAGSIAWGRGLRTTSLCGIARLDVRGEGWSASTGGSGDYPPATRSGSSCNWPDNLLPLRSGERAGVRCFPRPQFLISAFHFLLCLESESRPSRPGFPATWLSWPSQDSRRGTPPSPHPGQNRSHKAHPTPCPAKPRR